MSDNNCKKWPTTEQIREMSGEEVRQIEDELSKERWTKDMDKFFKEGKLMGFL
jgi:hypothetical protein